MLSDNEYRFLICYIFKEGVECPHCGKKFIRFKGNQVYCSRACQEKAKYERRKEGDENGR